MYGDLTFVVPVRIDGPDRLWNLRATLAFLCRRFSGAEIIVVEQALASRLGEVCADFPSLHHLHLRDDGRFSRAATVNAGALASSRRYLCMYDADILLAPQALDVALDCLARRGWHFVVPYNRICLDVSGGLRETLAGSDDFMGLDRIRRVSAVHGRPDVSARFVEGGVLVANREVFLAEGGANSRMRSYGWEDTEMIARFGRLGFPVLFLWRFSLIHLNHGRGEDSVPNRISEDNHREYLRVRGMSKRSLRLYVQSDLSLTMAHQPEALAAMRARHSSSSGLGLRALVAMTSLLRVHLQAHGVRAVLRRLIMKAVRRR